MRFCEKCGTQINDNTTICPQCQTPTNSYNPINVNQQPLPKRKSIKMYFIIPIIVILVAIITFLVTYFFLPNNPKSTDKTNSNSSVNDTFTTTDDNCPEDEYGHHSWSSATCENPSCCYNCGKYKDDKLGNHSFTYHESSGIKDCIYCGMLYDVYINSLEE